MPSITRRFPALSAARVMLLAIVVLGAWFASVAPAGAQTANVRYVATDGIDGGSCSAAAAPCASLDYALQQASDGDEVRLAEGVYTDPAPLVPVVIDLNELTITGDGDVSFLDNLLILNADAVTVRGIDFVGGTIVVAYSTEIVIDDVSMSSPPAGAIGVWGIASEVAVLDSAFSGNFSEAVRLQEDVGGELSYVGGGFDVLVQNVTVTGAQTGIQVAAMSAAVVNNVTVTGTQTAIEVGSLFLGEVATVPVPAAPYSAQITNSYFEGSTAAMTIYGDAPGGLDIHSNQVIGPVLLVAETTGEIAIDLEENWWGSTAGPSPSTFVNDGAASYDIDSTPWCGDPACTSLLPIDPPPVDPPPVDPPPVDPPPVDPPPVDPPPVDPPPVDPPPVDPPPVDPPPVDPPPVDPPPTTGNLPQLPKYYAVPDVVSVTVRAGDLSVELPARTKDEWLEEGRRLLPAVRDEDWLGDVVVTVTSEPGEDPGELTIDLPEGVTPGDLGR